ncbi:MAG: hypothetical protein LBN71_07175 [Tannerella sp.]|jgi:predicted transposase YdaD|nr:hypothetical protein [Tannerella sp.]
METYNKSILEYNDVKNAVDYAGRIGERRGIKKGEQKTLAKMAIKGTNKGMSLSDISDLTGLSVEQIKNILQKKN